MEFKNSFEEILSIGTMKFPRITDKQLECLIAINDFSIREGKFPTQSELANVQGTSQSNCSQHISNLLKMGYLEKLACLQRRNFRLTAIATKLIAENERTL